MKILIVEDDRHLADALNQILTQNKYEAEVVHDGQTGLEWALMGSYDIIIMDVMLPQRDGFSAVQELRRNGVSTPVLMLTARTTLSDRVAGLDSGADDYLTKPFEVPELLARIRALSRRQGEVLFETLEYADLVLDLTSFELYCNKNNQSKEPLRLSPREYELMHLLMANPGQTVSKNQIIDRVWDNNAEANSAEAYVSFLRKKLSFLESRVYIETLRGAGYRLAEQASNGEDSPSC